MNKLYLRIPTHLASIWPNGVLSFALCSKEGAILREGEATLNELSKDINKASVVLIISASDVNLLEITVPAIPEPKLKLALPNLVEDQLMGDAAESLLILLPKHANATDSKKRVVAVVQRSWLQELSDKVANLGAISVRAIPAQLCLPYQSGSSSVLLEEYALKLSTQYTLRFDVDQGVGMLLDSEQSVEDRLAMISRLAPIGPVLLHLPSELTSAYRSAIEAQPTLAERITIHASNWSNTIEEAKHVSLNLMSSLSKDQLSQIQWQNWRWPIVLGAVLLLVNIVGLNAQYWSLKREAEALKLGMAQTYKASFPKSANAPYPLDQMKRNLGVAQRNSGQPASYDFTVLLSGLGSAWSTLPSAPKIVSIEYKDHGLLVQVKGDLPQEALKTALAAKDLSLKKQNAEVWQIKEAE